MSVAAGAFAAHGLSAHLSGDRIDIFETAARYQMYHGLALIAVAGLAHHWPGRAVAVAAWAFNLGILIFSGSLYLLVLTGIGWLGAITPIGGVLFLIGWLSVILAARHIPR